MATDKPKLGAGTLAAMGRIGVHELRNALYPESNIAQGHSEYGLWSAPTPAQIVEAQEPAESGAAGMHKANDVPPPSILAERMQQVEARAREEQSRDTKSLERE